MTFSIVATDGEAWGVAVASKFLAVGAAVPGAEAGVGAIATQSYANLAYRPDGLAMLRDGKPAQEVIDALIAADDLREQRQVGIVDRNGGSATFSGSACHGWAGGIAGDNVAIQGNILTGPEVVDAMYAAWLATDAATPLARRLFAALSAGDKAGGDRRGRQSAAIYVVTPDGGYGGGSDQLVDLRVDDHSMPIEEMSRLIELHELFFTPADPESAIPLTGLLAGEVRGRLKVLGHPTDTDVPADLDRALADWAGIENFEERLIAGAIDPLVLSVLRAKT